MVRLRFAKTLFISTFSFFLCLILLFYCFFWNDVHKHRVDCAGMVNLDIYSDHSLSINANIAISAHLNLTKGVLNYFMETGTVTYENKKYIIDRSVVVSFSDVNKNGFSPAIRVSVNKNESDNVPEHIENILTSSQSVLFLKLEVINDEVWRLRDLRRTLLMCKPIS